MKLSYLNIILITITCLLFACKSDLPMPVANNPFTESDYQHSVFVVCEGNYTWVNASMSYFNSETWEVSNDLFFQKNNKDLGDVCQSMCIWNDKAYLMVNNSAKIEVVSPVTFQSIATIANINSPRYFCGINANKAYVSNIYGDSISVINLQNYSKSKSIYCKGWTEKMLTLGTKTYVCNKKAKCIYIIDNENDIITDSISIGNGTSEILLDKNNMIWTISTYDTPYNLPSKLIQINPQTKQITKSILINNTLNATNLCINSTKDTLYFTNNGVYKISINANSIPSSPMIKQKSGSIFYGLGVEPISNDIYIADALDYNQQGLVTRYTSTGDSLRQFRVGIIPNGFVFR